MTRKPNVRSPPPRSRLACAALSPSASAQTAEWKFSHWLPPTHSLHPILVGWARTIEKDSGGTLKISVFRRRQLRPRAGPLRHDREGHRGDGLGVHRLPGRPHAGVQRGPAAVHGRQRRRRLGSLRRVYRPYAAKDMPNVKLCLVHMHDVATLHSKKEIRTPDQIKA